MTAKIGFDLTAVEPLSMARSNRLSNMYTLSPFVWKAADVYHLLVRAVPRRDDEPRLKMAEIWHGQSSDGLHFEMDESPVIFPGPDLTDLDGCEDPTVLETEGQLRVWYTGWNEQQQTGRLLLSRGPDLSRMSKAGIALDSRPPFSNPKESTIAQASDGSWRMFFEYADNNASLIGQASAADPDGPWTHLTQASLKPRKARWDCWHLSPGPMIGKGGARPIMFYNGADQDANWRIGWAAFNADLTRMEARGEDPLITPTDLSGAATDIAFAASAVEDNGKAMLYFSQSDQDLRRATLAQT